MLTLKNRMLDSLNSRAIMRTRSRNLSRLMRNGNRIESSLMLRLYTPLLMALAFSEWNSIFQLTQYLLRNASLSIKCTHAHDPAWQIPNVSRSTFSQQEHSLRIKRYKLAISSLLRVRNHSLRLLTLRVYANSIDQYPLQFPFLLILIFSLLFSMKQI